MERRCPLFQLYCNPSINSGVDIFYGNSSAMTPTWNRWRNVSAERAYKTEQWPTVDRRYHRPIEWQSGPPFCPWCRPNSPRSRSQVACRTSVMLTAIPCHWNSSESRRWPLAGRRTVLLCRWRYSNRWDHNRSTAGSGTCRTQSRAERSRSRWTDPPKSQEL